MSSIGLCRFSVVSIFTYRMFSGRNSYEDAVEKLNSLQSNKATLDQIKKDIKSGKKCTNLEDMKNYLLRTGVTLTNLDELSVIHVAGTKGKGSTSAMCESILRRHGFRTGFYSSPHLVAVRERIRLDGRTITEDQFSKHFHRVYDMLEATKEYEGDMPRYFAFLTVMAYNLFLKEKVDVAIIEVGIGGGFDVTNVIRKVPVVGITALGLDHTAILGNTLPEIAAAKAGIMKPGCDAYSAPQPPQAMAVLKRFADDVQCTFNIVPDYNTYVFPNGCKSQLQVNLQAYQTNASLAIQLSHAWMRHTKLQALSNRNGKKNLISGKVMIQKGYKDIDVPCIEDKELRIGYNGITEIPLETAEGLRKCKWPGRFHVVPSSYANFHLDGAHTLESMEICAKWFSDTNRSQEKILIFSATGDRDPSVLLRPLVQIEFQRVYFVVPTAYKSTTSHSDNYSVVEQADLLARCQRNADAWEQLKGSKCTNVTVLECVSDALVSIKSCSEGGKTSVLVTGSLHLVGHTLAILDPHLTT